MKLADAYEIIENSLAVMVDGHIVDVIAQGLGNADGVFLSFSWSDENYYEYELEFQEDDNQEVGIEDECLVLTDSNGDKCVVTILAKKPISLITIRSN